MGDVPCGSSRPSWGRGGCWGMLEVVDLHWVMLEVVDVCWKRQPGTQGGLEYFSLVLLLISSLSQAPDSIRSAQVPDWMVSALVLGPLTHSSHQLNFSGV